MSSFFGRGSAESIKAGTKVLAVCPETGRDLAHVDIQKHVHTLWPGWDVNPHLPKEARERIELLLAEDARRREAKPAR